MFAREFGARLRRPPVLLQGLGLYTTHRLVGTRLTTFIEMTTSRYDGEEDLPGVPRLEDSNSDWLVIAHAYDRAGRLPRLAESMAVPLNQLQKQDLLLAYCMARYLVEGLPDHVREFLRVAAHESDEKSVVGLQAAAERVLEMPLPALDARLRRWVAEMVRLGSR
jgi:hypothetical protein